MCLRYLSFIQSSYLICPIREYTIRTDVHPANLTFTDRDITDAPPDEHATIGRQDT